MPRQDDEQSETKRAFGDTMADEIDEGVAYLRSLKQATSPWSAPATPARSTTTNEQANSTGTIVDSGDGFKGAEKRRSPRYKCEGSVELREEGCDVRTWATFTDISLHGCYVEAQATYPANTILHMKLDANGVRVETKGNVRVSYPYLGMGIAFVETSEETQTRLRSLLATLSRATVIVGPGLASSLPAASRLQTLPPIADPAAALQALNEFFESRQMLMREDFLRIVRQRQQSDGK